MKWAHYFKEYNLTVCINELTAYFKKTFNYIRKLILKFLWAQHASAAPLCSNTEVFKVHS